MGRAGGAAGRTTGGGGSSSWPSATSTKARCARSGCPSTRRRCGEGCAGARGGARTGAGAEPAAGGVSSALGTSAPVRLRASACQRVAKSHYRDPLWLRPARMTAFMGKATLQGMWLDRLPRSAVRQLFGALDPCKRQRDVQGIGEPPRLLRARSLSSVSRRSNRGHRVEPKLLQALVSQLQSRRRMGQLEHATAMGT